MSYGKRKYRKAVNVDLFYGESNGPRPENIDVAAKHFESKFQMLLYLVKRTRQLNRGMPPRIEVNLQHKHTNQVIAILEVMQGIIINGQGALTFTL